MEHWIKTHSCYLFAVPSQTSPFPCPPTHTHRSVSPRPIFETLGDAIAYPLSALAKKRPKARNRAGPFSQFTWLWCEQVLLQWLRFSMKIQQAIFSSPSTRGQGPGVGVTTPRRSLGLRCSPLKSYDGHSRKEIRIELEGQREESRVPEGWDTWQISGGVWGTGWEPCMGACSATVCLLVAVGTTSTRVRVWVPGTGVQVVRTKCRKDHGGSQQHTLKFGWEVLYRKGTRN